MNKEAIIAALNRNLKREYASVLFYIHTSNQPDIYKNRMIKDILSRLAEEEMRHAEKIADKISEMGGKSTWEIIPFDKKKTLWESLESIVQSEEESIREYTDLIEKLPDDLSLKRVLQSILNDEKNHRAKGEMLIRANAALLGSV